VIVSLILELSPSMR